MSSKSEADFLRGMQSAPQGVADQKPKQISPTFGIYIISRNKSKEREKQ